MHIRIKYDDGQETIFMQKIPMLRALGYIEYMVGKAVSSRRNVTEVHITNANNK